jgi:hypothetical protein
VNFVAEADELKVGEKEIVDVTDDDSCATQCWGVAFFSFS